MKKKILALVLALAMSLSLAACGSGDADEDASSDASASSSTGEEIVADESIPEESAEPDASTEAEAEVTYFSDIFNEAFIHLAENASGATYDSCRGWLDAMGYEYEVVEPDSETMGIITVEDTNGFHLTADFLEDESGSGVYYLCLLSYSDGNFEGSVSAYAFGGELTYGIYDITAEERNVDVDSLDDVIAFITEEVPVKMAEYEESISGNTEIEVTLSASYEVIDGGTYITVETNLPDGTTLMLTLSDDADYTGQSKVAVEGGYATSGGFSSNGEQLSGHYTLSVTMVAPVLQDESVAAIIGSQGEFLTGEYVSESATGGNTVTGTFEFDF